jgi:hypothetical protein
LSNYSYSFVVSFRDAAGVVVHETEVTDLHAVSQDLALLGVLNGDLPNDGHWGKAAIEPYWKDGELIGLIASLGAVQKTYGLSVVAEPALGELIEKGLLKGDPQGAQSLRWEVRAQQNGPAPARRLKLVVRRQPFPIRDNSPSDLEIEMPPNGEESVCVLASSRLLEELRVASGNSLDHERADILTGYLLREPSGRRAATVLLERIPAEADTSSSPVHISFSPTTFEAVRKEHERRNNGQEILGWHHNHPPPCGRDCLQTLPACNTENLFFSVADRAVHRASFHAPYMVGLVSGKGAQRRADDPVIRAYGWRNGVICERPFDTFENGVAP